jgi:hypothetical protein
MSSTAINSAPDDRGSSSDPIKFWGLDEKSRFPITPEDWDAFIQFPVRQRTKNIGLHDYDLIVNRKARRPATWAIARLFGAFRDDFNTASHAFDPVQWRLLHYMDQFPLANLANPCFDAAEALQNICSQETWKMEVPSEWTGSIVPSIVLLQDIPIQISQLDADVAKAAWTILAFARNLGLEKNDILQVPFWEIWWIERCLAALSDRDKNPRPHFPHAASVGPQSVRAAGLKGRGATCHESWLATAIRNAGGNRARQACHMDRTVPQEPYSVLSKAAVGVLRTLSSALQQLNSRRPILVSRSQTHLGSPRKT